MLHIWPDQWISKRLKAHFLTDPEGEIIVESRDLAELLAWAHDAGEIAIAIHGPAGVWTVAIDKFDDVLQDDAAPGSQANPLLPWDELDRKEIERWQSLQVPS